MKLSISNIAWCEENDTAVYSLMRKYGFSGLEIAPTRIIPSAPYDNIDIGRKWKKAIAADYGFSICSMQSIWYGRNELIFGTESERQTLIDYTKKAILFAEAIGCGNLVFGCPRNRVKPDGSDEQTTVSFFREIGDFAFAHNTCIAMEANPAIYNTNYINFTSEAIKLVEDVNSEGFKLNLDVGTMVENNETADSLIGCTSIINHVHISEPGLNAITRRTIHSDLIRVLKESHYNKYISIEMKRVDNMAEIEKAISYIVELTEK